MFLLLNNSLKIRVFILINYSYSILKQNILEMEYIYFNILISNFVIIIS